jgi:hypothetical protein
MGVYFDFSGDRGMKIALATTTIHVPHALKLMRKCSADVRFFVAIDEKTPEDAGNFCTYDVDNTQVVYLDAEQRWKCGRAIGRNTLAKRNLAFLEALAWGADAIYSHDDDNIPVNTHHFDNVEWIIRKEFSGVKVSNKEHWFDPGSLLIPLTRQRGMPWNQRAMNWAEPVVGAKIGVVSGLIIGDPDCDASTRIEKAPDIGAVHVLGQAGVVVDPRTWTIFNSQNTALVRELVPAFFLMPGMGRHDDVYGSLIVQRVARERGYHVHLGAPFCYQARNPHNLITDLRAEIDGMENVSKLADLLDSIILPGKSVIADTRIIYEVLGSCPFISQAAVVAALAWLEDCEGVM